MIRLKNENNRVWYNFDIVYPLEVIHVHQVLSVEEMRDIENKTIHMQQLTPFELMRKAGRRIYETHAKKYPKSAKFLLICGIGNNGGDALAFGEEAVKHNHQVHAVIIRDFLQQSPSAVMMTDIYQQKNMSIDFVDHKQDFYDIVKHLNDVDVIVDGLFGIGLSRDIHGLFEDVIKWMNKQKHMIISIDCPSGLNANTGEIMNVSVISDITYTIEAYKQGLIMNDGLDCYKSIEVVDVGMEKMNTHKYLMDKLIPKPPRKHHSHKYDYKSVLTIGGQIGVMGALTLAGKSALVSGAGLSTIATNEMYHHHFIRTVPEIMYETISDKNQLKILFHKKDAILFGLGLKEITDFEMMVYDEIIKLNQPLILDGAGMLLLKNKKKRSNSRTIITPHYGEFAKLMETKVEDIKEQPLKYINQCIEEYHCEVVLKGPSTIYATKDKILFLNQGSPALAKAGSGDVLAGIILTYASQDLPIDQAILLHMFAGKKAESIKHIDSILANDIIDQIGNVYKR